jgi:hypothetical protein
MSLESDEYTRLLLNLSRSRSVGKAESPLAQAKLSELLVLQGKRISKSITRYRLLKESMGEISEYTQVSSCPQPLIS